MTRLTAKEAIEDVTSAVRPRIVDGLVDGCIHLVMVESSEWTAIQHVVDRLKAIYPAVPPDTFTRVVHHNHARFDGRPVRDFVSFVRRTRFRTRIDEGGEVDCIRAGLFTQVGPVL